ncbi:MAG: hypothetical protein IT369_05325 [Candidatus Latescibacteria bacterium]|nr:hypothetical protein [Candidatus Latescibacterota bacterium]
MITGVQKAARWAQVLMGLVFLLSGGVKIWEPVLFFWEAVPQVGLIGLGVYTRELAQAAMLLGALEWGLGLALVCNWRPRVVLPVTTALMGFFVVIVGLALYRGGGGNCGCFGALIERTPGEALAEDLVMLGLLIFSWRVLLRHQAAEWSHGRWVVIGGTALALVVTGVRLLPDLDRLQDSDLRAGVRLAGLKLKGAEVDLGQGVHLVELFSPKCSHCMREVPRMNEWSRTEGLPPVVALTGFAQESPDLREFRERLQPLYPTATISSTDFLRLTAGHGYPRVALLRDGEVVRVWEHNTIPTIDEIKALVGP